MNIFSRLRGFIKRKSPATFNAAEYETARVLDRIQESDGLSRDLIDRTDRLERELGQVCAQMSEFTERLAAIESMGQAGAETSSAALDQCQDIRKDMLEIHRDIQQNEESFRELRRGMSDELRKGLADMRGGLDVLQGELDKRGSAEDRRSEEVTRLLNDLKQSVSRADLNAIVSCRSDNDYDKCLIPLNRYFNNRGMAVSMHLTSVAEKPDPIVYETADIIRTSTLSLISDEIHARKLEGAVAEFGVAEGKFARVINALFPEKPLHLFDTFEGFPKVDSDDDRQRKYSDTKPEWYTDIDMTALMNGMRHPENCVIHKGYFPDTAKGLEESFCFVNIDCDLYKPILAGLEYFYPRVVKGGYIFVHDYRSKYFTGVRPALTEFAEKNGISYCVLPDNTGTAVIIK